MLKWFKREVVRWRLQGILDRALARFEYATDTARFGKGDYWGLPWERIDPDGTLRGDCDDFALHCRDEARKLGYNGRLLLCRTETGRGHLVFEYDGIVLDNRSRWAEDYPREGYEYLMTSDTVDGGPWREILAP